MEEQSSPYGSISPIDRDLMIRTVIGEAGGDPSAAGVAHVILNRAAQSGKSPAQIVTAPGQFEPWQRNPQQLMSYSPQSPAYQGAAAVVDGALSGAIPDPTNGATKFFAPKAQAQLGRAPPKWDDGTGQQIGAHKFFGGSPPDLLGQWGAQGAPPAGKGAPPAVPDLLGGWQAPQAQQPAWQPKPAGAPGVVNASGVTPGTISPDGLVWDGAGGHDPKTGELIIAGKLFSNAPVQGPAGQALAATAGAVSGVPIVGPALEAGVVKAAAGINALRTNTPYDQNVAGFNRIAGQAAENYPNTALAGNIAGGVLGTGAAMIAAPGVMGVSAINGITPNMIAGTVSGSAIIGADSAIRSGNYSPALGSPMANGALTGAAFGLAGPVVGPLIGKGMNALVDTAARTNPAARNVAGILNEIGMTPQEARSALSKIGPGATLADIDPALTTEAAGLARLGGIPTSILKGAMAARAGAADNRVAQAIDSALGPKPDLSAVEEAIYQKASATASPYYNAARATAGKMDITPLLSDIDAQLPNASGGVKDMLNRAKSYLTSQTKPVVGPNGGAVTMAIPKDDPQALLGVRQALDDIIQKAPQSGDSTAGRNALRAVQNVRSQLDTVLKSDPNIAAGDAAFSQQMKIKEALDQGTELFTRGVRASDFQKSLAAMTPAQIDAARQGARVAIGDALEQARQGTLSAARSMFGKSTANRAKLDALFPGSGDVFDMLHGEAAMRATEQKVAQNSITAEAQTVRNKYSPAPSPGIGAAVPLVGEAIGGGAGAAGAMVGRALYGSLRDTMTRNALNQLTQSTASGLSATGPAQQDFLAQIARAARTGGASNALSGGAASLSDLLTRSVGPHALSIPSGAIVNPANALAAP